MSLSRPLESAWSVCQSVYVSVQTIRIRLALVIAFMGQGVDATPIRVAFPRRPIRDIIRRPSVDGGSIF